jgi:hypothetical protein
MLSLNVGEKLYIGKSLSSERYITRIHDRKIAGQSAYQFKLVEECNKDGKSCSADISKSTIWYVYFRGKGDYYSILMNDKGSEDNLILFDKIVCTLKVIQ